MNPSTGSASREKRTATAFVLAGVLLAAGLAACQAAPSGPQAVAYPVDDRASEKTLFHPLPPSDAPAPESSTHSFDFPPTVSGT